MTPDDLRIAVRQRSILECLDLACMFCVRRCPGIAVALLVGALPTWPHSTSWGYGPSGGVGLIAVILIVLLLMGRI